MYLYRVNHLLANLGWVDFDFACSTLCLVLPGLMGNWQNQAEGGTGKIKVNPTEVPQEMCHPACKVEVVNCAYIYR